MIIIIIQAHFIKIHCNMSESEKKQQRIYYLLNAENKSKFLCLLYNEQRKIFTGKELYKEKGKWRTKENRTNSTPHPNIGSLQTAIEEEWNEMSQEFILKKKR